MRGLIWLRFLICLSTSMFVNAAFAQEHSLSIAAAKQLTKDLSDTLHRTGNKAVDLKSDSGYQLQALDHIWQETADGLYFNSIQGNVDDYLDHAENSQGDIAGNAETEALQYGRSLLTLYKVTGQVKYFLAATRLWDQGQRLSKFTPDDFDVAIPFYAEYAALVENKNAFDAITHDFVLREAEIAKEKSGLLYERSIGQFGLALVEVLDYIPEGKNRLELLQLLSRCTNQMKKVVSSKAGGWAGFEPVTRSRYLYSLSKAARLSYAETAGSSFLAKGLAVMKNDNPFAKSGDKPGPSEPNALWLLAINELELYNLPKPGLHHIVMLDSYFNNETKTDQSGNLQRWHYKWDERDNNGFSMWGHQFEAGGYQTSTLYTSPTEANLKHSSVYIIVDPDTEKESKHPNYVAEKDVNVLRTWVKSGGVLVLMANDSANTELDNFNKLAKAFGVQFNKDSKGKVIGDRFDMGRIGVPSQNPVFKTAKNVFIKEFSSLKLARPEESILKDRDGNVVVGVVKYGKGTVLFVGDPWLYNEYVDGRKLPAEYDNFKAGQDIVDWIGRQLPR
jgi:unsaturated rhamnogalacturonyl hydrolase